MKILSLLSAAVVASTAAAVAHAASFEIVSDGGSASFKWTAEFAKYSLHTSRPMNELGNPEYVRPIRGTSIRDDGSLRGSRLIEGGALLNISWGGFSIYPVDMDGNEVESHADVLIFNWREESPLVTRDMKQINYVPTDDPNVFTDYRNPSMSYTLTDEQIALLKSDQLRLCCRHFLDNFMINTADMTLDGRLDNVNERDINRDGVIDENDEFYLFDLKETAEAGVYDMLLTETMAQYMTYGFTPAAFEDGQTLYDNWAASPKNGGPGFPVFSAGDVVGKVSYSYNTETYTTPVPLPAALPMLAAGFGALGLFGRRRNR